MQSTVHSTGKHRAVILNSVRLELCFPIPLQLGGMGMLQGCQLFIMANKDLKTDLRGGMRETFVVKG
jgi:hypothetical protein